VLLPRLNNDLLEIFLAILDTRLHEVSLSWRPESAVCVVMASGGYPGGYRKGLPITGLDEAARVPEVIVFHAGTRMVGDRLVTHGGRVLGVTALGRDMAQARERAYEGVARIHFEGAFCRKDIGVKR
jgi:phosphoribosylamine--glycine ligase